MVNSDDKPIFIDTNILVYAGVSQSPLHQTALDAIRTLKSLENNSGQFHLQSTA